MKNKLLPIALTFDIEKYDFDSSIKKSNDDSWDSISTGINAVLNNLEEIELRESIEIKATWFIRCDNEVKSDNGERAYLLEKYKNIWKDLSKKGHEIGFHPHLYCIKNNNWTLDTNPIEQVNQLKDSFKDFRSKGFNPISSKIGDAYCSNHIMNALNDLGIKFDCTAMPGRKRKDDQRNIDWSKTKDSYYYPSYKNYQVEGLKNYKLLEIPMTMIATRADYDKAKFQRYFDLSFHSRVFEEGYEKIITNSKYILLTSHPSTIIEGNNNHGLLSFSSNVFFNNLYNLIRTCKKNLIKYKFVRVKDLVNYK